MTRLSESAPRRFTPLIALGLCLTSTLAFFGVWRNGFVDYDDNSYVFLNPGIRHGLGFNAIRWAFSYVDVGHWIPLTWLSFDLDYKLYGLNPAGFHVTNLGLHTANVVLVFLLLQRITGTLWRSALVAAIFGVHPLRVESVAWVTERKDVLSGFFFLVSLIAYANYAFNARDQGNGRRGRSPWYWLAVATFALGLMSKSSVVVLPVLLLLLDYWPLGRFPVRTHAGLDNPRGPDPNLITLWKLTLEKLPFFGLSVASALITLSAQAHEMSAAVERRMIPIEYRLANGAVAVLAYLRQTVWPTDLSVFYPPTAISLSSSITIVAVLGVAAATALAVGLTRLRSYIGFGWCWFLVVLAPVSGFVQAGDIVQADRYTYLSSIGLSVMAVWALADLVEKNAKLRYASAATAAVAVALLASLSQRQVAVWRNTRTLFTHAASVTPSNHVALTMIAGLDLKDGKVNEAITNLTRVLEFAPKYPSAEYHLGEALQMQGRMVEAIPHLEAAAGPEVAVAGRARLVLSLIDAGRLPDAETALEGLLAAIPGQPDLLIMKAALLREQGRSEQAGGLFRSVTGGYAPALADNPRLNFEIAELYSLVAENRKAMPFFEKAVELAPDFVNALNDFAWILATDPDPQVRNGARAAELAERACKATGWKQPVIIGTLGAAYAEAGQFDKAIQMAEKARDLARQEQLEQIAAKNEELLKLYKEGKPYREIGK